MGSVLEEKLKQELVWDDFEISFPASTDVTAIRAIVGDVVSLLLLDVSGAFDYMPRPRLLHDLRKTQDGREDGRLDVKFWQNRSTTIQTQEHSTEPLAVSNGIP